MYNCEESFYNCARGVRKYCPMLWSKRALLTDHFWSLNTVLGQYILTPRNYLVRQLQNSYARYAAGIIMTSIWHQDDWYGLEKMNKGFPIIYVHVWSIACIFFHPFQMFVFFEKKEGMKYRIGRKNIDIPMNWRLFLSVWRNNKFGNLIKRSKTPDPIDPLKPRLSLSRSPQYAAARLDYTGEKIPFN